MKRRIGIRDITSLAPGQVVWDTSVTGFFARRQKSEAVSYGVKYRTAAGEQRWATIGRHGAPWTPDLARAEARRIMGEVAQGGDPSRERQGQRTAMSVADLCAAYLTAAETGRLPTRRGGTKRASTLSTDRSRISAHILPLLGDRKAGSLTQDDVEVFMHAVADGKAARKQKLGKHAVSNVRGGTGAATRTLGLLGAIFAYGVRRKVCTSNPVRGVIRPRDGRRNRRLSPEEYAGLATGLTKNGTWPHALTAIRFLALTGWRTGEVTGLRWSEVDLARRTAHLGDTKTGDSMRPLSTQAVAILEHQREVVEVTGSDELVFPAARSTGRMSGFPGMFASVAKAGGLLEDVTPHVLRHSFASTAADLGFSEPTIAALLGHKGGGITRRYIHSADAVLLAAADRVALEIARMMGDGGTSLGI
ncbi:tyrosine-type recombinase/integrase [Methylorubrum extorquens]